MSENTTVTIIILLFFTSYLYTELEKLQTLNLAYGMDTHGQFLKNVLWVYCVKLYKKKAVLSQENRAMQL